MDLIEYFTDKKANDKEILKEFDDIFINNMIKRTRTPSYNYDDIIKDCNNDFERYLKNKYGNITGKIIYMSFRNN